MEGLKKLAEKHKMAGSVGDQGLSHGQNFGCYLSEDLAMPMSQNGVRHYCAFLNGAHIAKYLADVNL